MGDTLIIVKNMQVFLLMRVVLLVKKRLEHLDESSFRALLGDDGILADVKGLFRNKISKYTYWSL